jgi:enolase
MAQNQVSFPLMIVSLQAREVLDSRGYPTVEVELAAKSSAANAQVVHARAIVPSGASTGEGEALELRDGDSKRYLGKGVLKAVSHVRGPIAERVVGKKFETQRELDQAILALDGTDFKSKLGANALLGVSMAFARARSMIQGESLWKSLSFGGVSQNLPVPLMNIINGGKHADNGLALQEFMIVPFGFKSFSEALRAGCEIFHALKKILHKKGLSTGVGDEGGFAPVFEGANPHQQAIECILEAISQAGYVAREQIGLALDCAASEFCKDGKYQFEGKSLSAKEMVAVYSNWVSKYPIVSIEDGLAEGDWDGWKALTESLGQKIQLVGDDLFVTNPVFLKKGIEQKIANSILIKLNQIGTVTETLDTIAMARAAGYSQITSHRSGETEDTFIADLAVATGCGQIKTGSASRTDRIAKYNQLLRIQEEQGSSAVFDSSRFLSKH